MEPKTIQDLFERQVEAFTESSEFAALEAGRADYDAFIANVARAQLKSPQFVAFLYALAPPAAAPDLLGNLLEELGLGAHRGQGGGFLQRARLQVRRPRPLAGHRRAGSRGRRRRPDRKPGR